MSEDSVIKKWTKAIVNLECKLNVYGSSAAKRLLDLRNKDSITNAEYIQRIAYLQTNTWSRGTAIYAFINNSHYLITAAHVIEDTADPVGIKYNRNASNTILLVQNASKSIQSNKIVTEDGGVTTAILNLNAGLVSKRPFELSDNDLGIINIDLADKKFVEQLNNRGYKPITITDIDVAFEVINNQEVIAFGFPSESEVISRNLPYSTLWQSNGLSIPFITKGLSQIVPGDLNFFSGKIFVYHGFSGGPIVKNNKLIGLVQGDHPDLKKTSDSNLEMYVDYRNNFIKSSLIMPLINKMEQRLRTER